MSGVTGAMATAIGTCIRKSWDLLWRYPVVFILGVVLAHMISSLALGLLYGPVMCGIMFATLKGLRGGVPEFNDLFRGFDRFTDSLLAGGVVGIVLSLTMPLCLLGVFLAPFFLLTFAFVIDQGMPWDKALSASWQAARKEYGRFLGFTILTGLFAVAGLAVCCVGVVVTASVATMASAALYADVTGTMSAGSGGSVPPPPAQAGQA